jgi:hypothetical protein
MSPWRRKGEEFRLSRRQAAWAKNGYALAAALFSWEGAVPGASASAATALLQLLTVEPSGHVDSGTADLSYRLLSGFILIPSRTHLWQCSGRNSKGHAMHAKPTSYGISRPEAEVAACYLCATLPTLCTDGGVPAPVFTTLFVTNRRT